MDRGNQTVSTDFIILGFSSLPDLRLPLFIIFLTLHLVTLAGNVLIFTLILMDARLHTPMYFFLCSLSSVEVFYNLAIVPKMLMGFIVSKNSISFVGCVTQMYFFVTLGGAECFFLTIMAYDRYVAICNPLRYLIVMNRKICVCLVVGSCIGGVLLSLVLTTCVFRLPICGSREINHFFCDIPPVLSLTCSDAVAEITLFVVSSLILMVPVILILISYIYIVAAILRIRSEAGRRKAFSTCASHLFVCLLHYGCAIFIYLRPKSSYSLNHDKLVAVVYTNVTPLLYPMIYTMRNKDVKGALIKVLGRKTRCQ
ncbi:olfactory receptor 10J1-like [Microcaecilia unicolor]|uniref:Olfactory receptor n=1 Tax=Microcaecilia unicolor TaxID=1415580 RepID=A0A6P7XBG1_9AMPH|nr:olfactory receptor 10J1-like [Microcaecilia unicolor]